MKIWAIVLAAGSGSRYGGQKQYELLHNSRVIDVSITTAQSVCEGVVVVLPRSDASNQALLSSLNADEIVFGGATRSDSVRTGLEALPNGVTHVLVHDAARPCASAELYERVIDAMRNGATAVIPGVGVTDTIKRVQQGVERKSVSETLDRDELVAVQTPQGFSLSTLLKAHDSKGTATDDAGLVEQMGETVDVVDGETTNVKITTRGDIDHVRNFFAQLKEQ